tara:strand:+ start:784 stop:1017 length:234 start_codon:yes stop_codon:yes gene_type:complete
MRIINGKWQDDNQDPVDNFNVSQLLEIGEKVKAVYGNKITYNRIALMSSMRRLTNKEESSLAYILEQDGLLSKLAGY